MEAKVTDIQRMKCMCGEFVCSRCGHRMTAIHEIKEGKITHCPACGIPFQEALNKVEDNGTIT